MIARAWHNYHLLRTIQIGCWFSLPFVLIFPQYFELIPFVVGTFIVSMIGSSAGMHRYFAHKSFKTGKIRHWFIAIASTLSTQGSIAWWVDMHRIHHAYTDTEKDPISPVAIGAWRSFFCLQDRDEIKRIRPRAVVKELRDPAVKFCHDWYWFIIAIYCAILYVFGGWTYILNAYFLPVFLVRFNFGINNVFGHGAFPSLGYRNYETKDNSCNGILINAFSGFGLLGEALHNNHHGNPGAWDLRLKWYEIDFTATAIKYLFLKNEKQ